MEQTEAVAALGALAHPTRLDVFRRLVQAGPTGDTPSALADQLDLAAPTLSFHLKELKLAGVVDSEREGRSLRYTPRFDAMRDLIAFLLEDCCGGRCGSAAVVCVPESESDTNQEETIPCDCN